MDVGKNYIYRSLWGFMGAFCAVLLPRPRLAKANCRQALLKNVAALADHFSQTCDYYKHSKQSVFLKRFQIEVDEIKTANASLAAGLDKAWWEGFDFCGLGHSRDLMLRLNVLCGTVIDILYAANIAIEGEFSK